jgi:hypothetical protein
MNPRSFASLVLIGLLLAGCGSGSPEPATGNPGPAPSTTDPPGGGSPWTYKACDSIGLEGTPASSANASPAGLWGGTLTNELLKQTEPYTAIIAPDGQLRLLSTGHTQFAGTLEVNGNAYTATGFVESGGTRWNDGSLLSQLTMGGQIAERDSLQGEWLLASGDAGCFDFAYDADLYERPSSLDLVEGTWIVIDAWGDEFMRWPVHADGSFASVDHYGCGYTGRFTLIDPARNLYAAEVSTEPTTADALCLSPGPLQGLAWIDMTETPSPDDDSLGLSLVSEGDTWRVYFGR